MAKYKVPKTPTKILREKNEARVVRLYRKFKKYNPNEPETSILNSVAMSMANSGKQPATRQGVKAALERMGEL